jgi:hypothetical protein
VCDIHLSRPAGVSVRRGRKLVHALVVFAAFCVTVLAGLTLFASDGHAQGKLVGYTQSGISPLFETWRFGNGGVAQPVGDSGTVRVTNASEWSLPFGVRVPIGERWSFDVSGAYAHGVVRFTRRADGTGAATQAPSQPTSDQYTMSGLSDIRVRATGRFVGDNVLFTVGGNLPTGKTSLNREELSALQVLGAPGLSFATPVLGVGASGTVGVVLAKAIGNWALAFGSSYQVRRHYTPVAIEAALLTSMNPGNVVHLSLGTDGLIGQSRMNASLSADIFSQDRLTLSSAGGGPSGTGEGGPANSATVHLGPIFTADWQLHLSAPRLRDLTLYVVDRYRTPYEREGNSVDGSRANYLDVGVNSVLTMGPSTALAMVLNGRHQTGMRVDNTLATAAVRSAAIQLGVEQQFGTFSVQPFVRGQLGQLKSGDETSSITGLAAGLRAGLRF